MTERSAPRIFQATVSTPKHDSIMALVRAVISTSAGINCPSDIAQLYDQETTVSLEAIPDNRWTFDGWEENCTGSDSCEVSISSDINVSARFIESTVNNPVEPGAMSSILLFLLNN